MRTQCSTRACSAATSLPCRRAMTRRNPKVRSPLAAVSLPCSSRLPPCTPSALPWAAPAGTRAVDVSALLHTCITPPSLTIVPWRRAGGIRHRQCQHVPRDDAQARGRLPPPPGPPAPTLLLPCRALPPQGPVFAGCLFSMHARAPSSSSALLGGALSPAWRAARCHAPRKSLPA